jgi:hypothetical protein
LCAPPPSCVFVLCLCCVCCVCCLRCRCLLGVLLHLDSALKSRWGGRGPRSFRGCQRVADIGGGRLAQRLRIRREDHPTTTSSSHSRRRDGLRQARRRALSGATVRVASSAESREYNLRPFHMRGRHPLSPARCVGLPSPAPRRRHIARPRVLHGVGRLGSRAPAASRRPRRPPAARDTQGLLGTRPRSSPLW